MAVPSNSKQVNDGAASAPSRATGRTAPAGKDESRSSSSTAARGAQGTDRAAEARRAAEVGVRPVRAPIADIETTDAIGATDAVNGAGEAGELAIRKARSARGRSLRKELDKFVMPDMENPSVLQATSAIRVMEDFIVNGLPNLEGTKELRSLAVAVIKDEIARHRALLDRRHHGIAA
jgi:hypothetical protein